VRRRRRLRTRCGPPSGDREVRVGISGVCGWRRGAPSVRAGAVARGPEQGVCGQGAGSGRTDRAVHAGEVDVPARGEAHRVEARHGRRDVLLHHQTLTSASHALALTGGGRSSAASVGSSPGAPRCARGLPVGKPGLGADTHDLAKKANWRFADLSILVHDATGGLREGAAGRPGMRCLTHHAAGFYGARTGHECQRRAPACGADEETPR